MLLKVSFQRLFNQFKPKNYELNLKLDKKNLKFEGTVTITGSVRQETKVFSLHAKNLKIQKITVNNRPADHEIGDYDELRITTPEPINGEVKIHIAFSGKITKPMHGLYPCYAKTGDVILATQFESHHAREVFPCIDEPEAKASFDLTLITDKNETVLSNMPHLQQVTENNGLQTTVFEQTPVMSTYLLAFVVGNLQRLSGQTNNGTKVNVWSSKDHSKKYLEFALDTAIKVTEFFNKYFQTAYPLPKCDHIALPDFSSGAMENWGLITYREVCLLVDPAKTSTATKEYVATVIAHELSHQWFGNLVTMKWWDDLWLNESFATLMEYLAVDHIYPEWDIMLSFAAHEALSASRRDMLPGVQAVATAVEHPDQISTLFDPSIVYAKGARLLLMAHNIVGEKAFREGLRQYFKDHAYQNTAGKHLWHALSQSSGINMAAIMKTWVSQPGFPMLSVKSESNKIKITQSKFNSTEGNLWPVPLFASENIGLDFLSKKTVSINNDFPDLMLNTAGGHYSVHYEDKTKLLAIKQQIIKGKLTPAQKLILLNDLSLQAKIGACSIVDIFDLLDAFKNEKHEQVWSVISLVIAEAKRIIDGLEQSEDQLKQFTYNLISSQYERLGWDKKINDSSNNIKLREIILALATYSENDDAIAQAKKRFSKNKITNLPSDTRHIIMSTAVKFGDETIFNNLLELYPGQTNSDLQQDIAGALTSTKSNALAKTLLTKLKDPLWVRPQDMKRFVVYLMQNKHTKKTAWAWLVKNWTWIEKNFASDKSYDNYPRYCASAFATTDWLKEYKAFFGPKKKIPALKRNIVIGEAEIKAKAAWTKRDHKKLSAWLQKNLF